MKKLLLLVAFSYLQATSIGYLLDKIKETPDYKIDSLSIKQLKATKDSIRGSLFPKVSLFGAAERYNVPTGMKPLLPTESGQLIATHSSLPFSKSIYKVGFNISMPIFVKEIYDNKKRIEHLLNASRYQVKINLIKKQALLVTYLSNLNYLYALKSALVKQKNSIYTSYKAIKVGVEVGRIPEFKLLRLKDALNQITIKISQIDRNIIDIKSSIYKVTQVHLKKVVRFRAKRVPRGDFYALKPLREKLIASRYDIQAKKDAFLPKVSLKVVGSRSMGEAYNTGKNVYTNMASAGLYVNWDILNKKASADIQKAKVQKMQTSLEIAKTKKDLQADIRRINQTLKEINQEISYINSSLKIKKELLIGAKTAFKLGRMSVDEYLAYEDDLAKTRADLANLKALQNSFKAQKGLIYGINLKRIFR